MKKTTAFLLATTGFLAGVITGFLFAPVKHGVSIGNHNGNNNRVFKKKQDDDWDYEPEDYFDDPDDLDDDDEEELQF